VNTRFYSLVESAVMNAGDDSGYLAVGEIALSQNLALLDRRLVERIDPEQAGGNDGLQHEMHEQFAEASLVQPLDVDGAHRSAVFDEGPGGGAALRGNEVADCPARKGRLAGRRCEVRGDARTAAGGAGREDREPLVAR